MNVVWKWSVQTAYVHLWSTTSQQINQSGVEGHDGISQVHPVLLVLLLSSKPDRKKQILSHDSAAIYCGVGRSQSTISVCLILFQLHPEINYFSIQIIDRYKSKASLAWMSSVLKHLSVGSFSYEYQWF